MNTHPKKQLRIIQCRDSLMWYASLVGQTVPYLGTWPEGYRSREPAGYINVVRLHDAELIDVEADSPTNPFPENPPERRTLQAAGEHPTPCARTCEANAFRIEIRGLKAERDALAVELKALREILREAASVLEWYEDANHIRTLHRPGSWVEGRKNMEDEGFRMAGENHNGSETFVESGKRAEAAAVMLRAVIDEAEQAKSAGLSRSLEKAAAERDALAAELKALREQEPVSHEFQAQDGSWRGFINESHYKNTVEDGSWPIRALYAHPAPARELTDAIQAIGRRSTPMRAEEGHGPLEFDNGWNQCLDAIERHLKGDGE